MAACTACGAGNVEGASTCQQCAAPMPWGAALAPWPPVYYGISAPAAWQDGSKLVLPEGTILPDLCVKCGAPAQGFRLERKLHWLHPAFLLLLVCGPLLYLIFSALLGKTATVEVGVCPTHRRRRHLFIAGGWGLALLGLFGFWLAIHFEVAWPAIAGVGSLLVGMFGGLLGARLVYAARMDERYLWLGGVDRRYLSQLPARLPR